MPIDRASSADVGSGTSTSASKVVGPVTAHVYHPLETRRSVIGLHDDDLAALGVRDHDWIRVWGAHQQRTQAVLARIETADYRRGMTSKPIQAGHPRLSRALRSEVEVSRRRFPDHHEQVFIAEAGELANTTEVLGIVHPEPQGDHSIIWVDAALDLELEAWVEVERPEVDGHGRRIRGYAHPYAVTVTQLQGTASRYVALARSQQALLGMDMSELQPGTGAQLPELVLRRVPDMSSRPPQPLRDLSRSLARAAVGESNLMAEVRLGSHLDALVGLARLSQNLYDALGLTDGDWVCIRDGKRVVFRRAIIHHEAPASGAERASSDHPGHEPGHDEDQVGRIWLDGEALGKLDLRRGGDSVMVGRDPVQTVRAAIGNNVLSAVLAFATVVVIEQSIVGVIAAVLAAALVLYIAFARERSRVQR